MAKWWRSMRCGSITGRRTAAKHRSGAEAAAGRRDSSPPTPELSTGKTNPQAPGWNKRTRVGLAGRTRMKLVPAKSSMEARHRGGSAAAPVAACAHVVAESPPGCRGRSCGLACISAQGEPTAASALRESAPAEASSGARGEGDHLVEIVRARDRWRHFLRLRGRKVNLPEHGCVRWMQCMYIKKMFAGSHRWVCNS
nr:uncharacterized protein LOC120962752 [Aegilops tauschii subsp. strangulata]